MAIINDTIYSSSQRLLSRFNNDGRPQDTSFQAPGTGPKAPDFAFTNTSFSGTDCTPYILFNQHIIQLGSLATFTYSIHREKVPVRTLGRIHPKNYTRGTRTIAGTMIFMQFNEHPLYPLFNFFDKHQPDTSRYSSPLADEIPPFDIMLIFNNESGISSVVKLYAVEMVDEGTVYSINDIYSETTMQFMARDMDPMITDSKIDSWKRLLYKKSSQGLFIDDNLSSILKQKGRIEKEIHRLEIEIQKAYKDGRGPLWAHILQDKVDARKDSRSKGDNLIAEQTVLKTELVRINGIIENYHRNKTTWDHNANLGR